MSPEQSAVVQLNMVSEIGPKKIVSLVNYFGSAVNVLNAGIGDLQKVEKITEKTALSIKKTADSKKIDNEIKLAKDNNINIVTYMDESYPEQLKDIYDFPPVLYIKGNLKKNDKVSVAVVGSRTPTNYGRSVTNHFCKYFAENDICVISGLARGIDTEAHQTVLKNNGRTIAVLGNGLLHYYPSENRKLQDQIGRDNVLISEFPLQQKPEKTTFPRRNRIIAGLSMATVITEAIIESGAMITAKLGLDYGRDVFAVPGSIFSNYSKGPNSLIKDGSLIALKPEDVVESIHSLSLWVTKKKKQKKLTTKNINDITNTRNLKVLKLIESAVDGISVDKLSQDTKIDIPELAMILMDLELDGFVRAMPGQVYIRNR
ncbi:DNA-processing protein DprA [Elusimicrobiota bacterium]